MTHEKWIKLTPEEKRIKIAELCGWKWVKIIGTKRALVSPNGYEFLNNEKADGSVKIVNDNPLSKKDAVDMAEQYAINQC